MTSYLGPTTIHVDKPDKDASPEVKCRGMGKGIFDQLNYCDVLLIKSGLGRFAAYFIGGQTNGCTVSCTNPYALSKAFLYEACQKSCEEELSSQLINYITSYNFRPC